MRTALILNSFMRLISATILSKDTTYPPSGSSSCLFTPFISIGLPLTVSWPFCIFTVRKPTFCVNTSTGAGTFSMATFPCRTDFLTVAVRRYRYGVSALHNFGLSTFIITSCLPSPFFVEATVCATTLPSASANVYVMSALPLTEALIFSSPSALAVNCIFSTCIFPSRI